MTDPWNLRGPLVAEHVLTDEMCDDLIHAFKASGPRRRSYQGVVNGRQRNCDFSVVPDPLAHQGAQAVTAHTERYFGVSTRPVTGQSALVYRYGPGVGFVTHHDEVTDIELKRSRTNNQPVIGGDITTVLLLNNPDEYGGGALYFETPALEVRPPRGTLIAFPATRQFPHGVRPVEFGERYTLLIRRTVVKTYHQTP